MGTALIVMYTAKDGRAASITITHLGIHAYIAILLSYCPTMLQRQTCWRDLKEKASSSFKFLEGLHSAFQHMIMVRPVKAHITHAEEIRKKNKTKIIIDKCKLGVRVEEC